jgi:hypothetical protein
MMPQPGVVARRQPERTTVGNEDPAGATPGGNENEFLVAGPPWLLVEADAVGPDGFPAEAVVRLEFEDPDNVPQSYTPVFTDHDLATRCAEMFAAAGVHLRPFRSADLDRFEALLWQLVVAGITHVGFDPEPARVRLTPIHLVIRGLQNRPR